MEGETNRGGLRSTDSDRFAPGPNKLLLKAEFLSTDLILGLSFISDMSTFKAAVLMMLIAAVLSLTYSVSHSAS
jgi:hypothetical protein